MSNSRLSAVYVSTCPCCLSYTNCKIQIRRCERPCVANAVHNAFQSTCSKAFERSRLTSKVNTCIIEFSSFMDSFWGTLRFLQLGVQSNWFGLACPAHCGSPSPTSLLAAFLGGFLCCLLLVGACGLRLLGSSWPNLSPPSDPQSSGLARLSRYLHEPNSYSRQRRR